MDYEKAYKAVLQTATQWIKDGCTDKEKVCLESVFPELRESEDERIRKALIQFLNDIKSISESGRTSWAVRKENAEMCNGFLTYLEKQKEQKHYWKPTETDVALFNKVVITNNALTPAERAQLDIIRSKFGYCRAANCSGIVQEEQEPAKEIKDQRQIYFMIEDGRRYGRRCGVIEGRKQVIDNPEEYGLQKQAEWSEEDEKMIGTIVSVLGQYIDYKAVSGTGTGYATPRYSKEIDWLKSIRPSWKPNEEQMEALLWCVAHLGGADRRVLAELYEHLKKL